MFSIKNWQVQETNFNSYPLLRMDETPQVEVHIVSSADKPFRIGGMANPVIVPIRPEDLKA